MYYFVEKDDVYVQSLKDQIRTNYPNRRTAYAIQGDCNVKLIDMADFLKSNNNFRALAFIDPYGMTVNWSSIEALKALGVDLWILVPTGLGVNRLLKNDGNITDAWLLKLEKFLGLNRDVITNHFYKKTNVTTLFGDDLTLKNKETNIVQKIGALYKERLKSVFEFVSDSFVMRNSNNSIMYHFMMATNNPAAIKIANDVVKPQYKL